MKKREEVVFFVVSSLAPHFIHSLYSHYETATVSLKYHLFYNHVNKKQNILKLIVQCVNNPTLTMKYRVMSLHPI